jgi:predicted Fe-S protein YdhL (DUF1289 family)
MKTPCNKVCVIDEESGLCKGCLRTLEEIGRWGQMSESEREEIFSRLEKRKQQQAAPDAAA